MTSVSQREVIDLVAPTDERARRAYDQIPVGVLVFDASGSVVDVNQIWSELSGRTPEASIGRGWERAVHPRDLSTVRAGLSSRDGRSRTRSIDCRMLRHDGVVIWTRWSWRASALPGHRCVVAIIDIDRERVREHELLEQASKDPLTGLANRNHFIETVDRRLAALATRPTGLAVLYLDLDHFKAVNDSAGHLVGDLVLRRVASRLRSAVRPGDLVARLGGDEFAVLCSGLPDDRSVDAVVERVRRAFVEPVDLPAGRWALDATVGAAFASTPSTTASALIGEADEAMYASKRDRDHAEALRRAADRSAVGDPGDADQTLRELFAVGLLLRQRDGSAGRDAAARDAAASVIDELVHDVQRRALDRRIARRGPEGPPGERLGPSGLDAVGDRRSVRAGRSGLVIDLASRAPARRAPGPRRSRPGSP